jgi:site-specific DNA recombinase
LHFVLSECKRYKMDAPPLSANKTKVAIYARVSTDTQELEHQLSSCERYCQYKGFEIMAVHKEIGSGKTYRNRPEFVKLLADLRAMKYDGVVIFRLDRLFRNMVEAVNIIYELEGKGVRFYSINEGFDTSTAAGRAMRDVILVLAQLERENISEATKDRLQMLQADGVKLGRPRVSDSQIKKIAYLKSQGLSCRKISEQMNIKKSAVAKYIKICDMGLSDRPQNGGSEKC